MDSRRSSSSSSSGSSFDTQSIRTRDTTQPRHPPESNTSSSSSSSRTASSNSNSTSSISISSTGSSSQCSSSCHDTSNSNNKQEATSECTMRISGEKRQQTLVLLTQLSGLPGDDEDGISSSSSRRLIFTASSATERYKLCCLDCASGSVHSFGRTAAAVKSLLAHGDKLFTAHLDRKIRVWQCSSSSSSKHQHRLLATLPSAWDQMLTCVLPGGHVRTRRHKRQLRVQHFDAISALAVSSSRSSSNSSSSFSDLLLYSASWDRTVKVWRLRDFRCVDSFRAHADAVNAMVASSDGHLYTASADCKVNVWERRQEGGSRSSSAMRHLLAASLSEHRAGVNALALSCDEAVLFSASGDKLIIAWDRSKSSSRNSRVCCEVLQGHNRAVLCLATTSRHILCSGSADKTIRLWSRQQEEQLNAHCCVGVLQGHKAPVKSLSAFWSSAVPSGCRVFSGGLDGSLRDWRISLADDGDNREGGENSNEPTAAAAATAAGRRRSTDIGDVQSLAIR